MQVRAINISAYNDKNLQVSVIDGDASMRSVQLFPPQLAFKRLTNDSSSSNISVLEVGSCGSWLRPRAMAAVPSSDALQVSVQPASRSPNKMYK